MLATPQHTDVVHNMGELAAIVKVVQHSVRRTRAGLRSVVIACDLEADTVAPVVIGGPDVVAKVGGVTQSIYRHLLC